MNIHNIANSKIDLKGSRSIKLIHTHGSEADIIINDMAVRRLLV
jgi:hypothetical protein